MLPILPDLEGFTLHRSRHFGLSRIHAILARQSKKTSEVFVVAGGG
jgi:hypothetical protein